MGGDARISRASLVALDGVRTGGVEHDQGDVQGANVGAGQRLVGALARERERDHHEQDGSAEKSDAGVGLQFAWVSRSRSRTQSIKAAGS